MSWAAEWIYDFLRAENVEVNPDVKKAVWTALKSLSSSHLLKSGLLLALPFFSKMLG